jgi:hypothetical protein
VSFFLDSYEGKDSFIWSGKHLNGFYFQTKGATQVIVFEFWQSPKTENILVFYLNALK